MVTQVWFVRHGEVEAPFVGTFVGRSDIGLSDLGRHQAVAAAELLQQAPIEAVVSSPRSRAKDTAGPLAKHLGMELEIVEGMAEMDFGEWECLSWPDIEARDADFAARWQADPTRIPCPGGESAGQFADRAHQALEELLRRHDGKTIALFAHAGINRALISHVTGMPYMDTFCFAQDYGCVNAASWDLEAGHGQIAMVNLVPGPRSVDHGDGGRNVG